MPKSNIYVDKGVARKRTKVLSHTAKKRPSTNENSKPPLLTQY